MSETANGHLRKADGIELHVVDGQCVVYDPGEDCLHYLNPTAALVLELCDEDPPLAEIAALVQEAYGLPYAPLDEVNRCVSSLKELKLIG